MNFGGSPKWCRRTPTLCLWLRLHRNQKEMDLLVVFDNISRWCITGKQQLEVTTDESFYETGAFNRDYVMLESRS